MTQIFPPPGPDRRDSFFARTVPSSQTPARLTSGSPRRAQPEGRDAQGVAGADGRRRARYRDAAGTANEENPADPYMTVLGYFNSLRELGGARRILEEEVQNTIKGYGARRRIGEEPGLFQDRKTFSEVVELTSRVPTDKVAEARRRLGAPFDRDHEAGRLRDRDEHDLGRPRHPAARADGRARPAEDSTPSTSRPRAASAADDAPGLVVTLLNIHKPRDRSHYERFRHFHETFYRSVEVASVTPFSARALDRGFAGALVALARHCAAGARRRRRELSRSRTCGSGSSSGCSSCSSDGCASSRCDEDERAERLASVQDRIVDLLDSWQKIFDDYQHARRRAAVPAATSGPETRSRCCARCSTTTSSHEHHRKFRVNRSLRDVEPR